MSSLRQASRDFWIAVGLSVAFHAVAGIVFWGSWTPSPGSREEMDVQWTWSAPDSGRVKPEPVAPLKEAAAPSVTSDAQAAGPVRTESGPAPAPGLKPAAPAAGTESLQGNKAGPSGTTAGSAEKTPAGNEFSGDEQSTGYALIPPRIKTRPVLRMPDEAVRASLSGDVLLTVEILEDGRVGKISLGRSSGSRILDEAARENVASWRFEPARQPKGLKPVRVLTSVWVQYPKEGS